ncbi:hypothetical protein C2845_PM15G09010 [Panicum miliaceum]|uniref:F-box domain-containing protein n=1 Tax=Panicum miliaceum TaxID=4540 RepID=A0A3L6QBL4_PANMI|nr:hypothetical protein C2845_PM15G09010 [Panicum miliaceum]
MEAAPKRARAGGGEAPDRLSALPDELLRRVLSFLPSRQAVQTTVLSKRWIDLWRSMPAIDLNIMDFECGSPAPGQYEKTMWGKMENFTTNLLMRHRAPRLDAFRLRTRFICRRDVDRWIRRAIEYCPVEFEITVLSSVSYQPPKLFSCHLKRLVLSGVYLEHNFGEQLRSECPVLEDLVLRGCREFTGLHSDTLKKLVVHTCSSRVADELVIRAPSLASLYLEIPFYTYKNGVLLDTEKFLVEASISLAFDELSRRGEAILLGSLFNVTSLELKSFNAMAILHKEFDKSPVFDNLRTLSLNCCFHCKHDVNKFKALGKLLQKLPNLEKLSLKNFWYDEGTEREVQKFQRSTLKTVRPVVGPNEFPILENLRTVLLDECDLRDNIRLLCHFLQSSPNLEKLTVRLCKLPKVLEGKEKPGRRRDIVSSRPLFVSSGRS